MKRIFMFLIGRKPDAGAQGGFTMLEIVVAMAAAAFVLAGSVSSYFFLSKTYEKHKQFTKAHRSLRGPVAIAAADFQSSGRSGLQTKTSGAYGILDIKRKALDGSDDPAGWPSLTYATLDHDVNGDGRIDDADGPPKIIVWRLYDEGNDGVIDLLREETDPIAGTVTQTPIARNIENIGFAFAVDKDRNGVVDTNNVDRSIDNTLLDAGDIAAVTQWCVDTDNDNVLDAHLDATMGGLINGSDDPDGDGWIDAVPIPATPLARIRQVAIYVLVRSELPESDYVNKNTYVVGQWVWHPVDASDPMSKYRRQVISIGITMRNREEELAI